MHLYRFESIDPFTKWCLLAQSLPDLFEMLLSFWAWNELSGDFFGVKNPAWGVWGGGASQSVLIACYHPISVQDPDEIICVFLFVFCFLLRQQSTILFQTF